VAEDFDHPLELKRVVKRGCVVGSGSGLVVVRRGRSPVHAVKLTFRDADCIGVTAKVPLELADGPVAILMDGWRNVRGDRVFGQPLDQRQRVPVPMLPLDEHAQAFANDTDLVAVKWSCSAKAVQQPEVVKFPGEFGDRVHLPHVSKTLVERNRFGTTAGPDQQGTAFVLAAKRGELDGDVPNRLQTLATGGLHDGTGTTQKRVPML